MNSNVQLQKFGKTITNQIRFANINQQKFKAFKDQKDRQKPKIFNLGTIIDPNVPKTKPPIFSSQYFSYL